MMEQLIKATSVPFQAIHFTQNARLIPADNMSLERHKILVRHRAFRTRYHAAAGSVDFEYVNKVNAAFSRDTSAGHKAAPIIRQPGSPKQNTAVSTAADSVAGHSDQILSYRSSKEEAIPAYADHTVPDPPAQLPSEMSAAYAVQRGSFELRVAKGELSYVPPLVMTIITQYPDIHFEYTGGFNYIPPQEDSSGITMNLSI